MDEKIAHAKLRRAEEKVVQLERMIEDRTRDLFLMNESAAESDKWLRTMYETIPGALMVVDPVRGIVDTNSEVRHLLGFTESEVIGQSLDLIWRDGAVRMGSFIDSEPTSTHHAEEVWRNKAGDSIPVLVSSRLIFKEGFDSLLLLVGVDMRQTKSLEVQLRHAQKMESIGQMAAGIAHEINTPMQYINDSLFFIRDAVKDLESVLQAQASVIKASEVKIKPRLLAGIREVEKAADLGYLLENLPAAIERSISGVERVTQIVRAVKSFSRSTEFAACDLNECVRNTMEIARNEYKYCAEVRLDLEPLPLVECNQGEINQVLLNLLVNAAHAIEDAKAIRQGKGLITLRSFASGEWVVLEIGDNGCGIPESIRHRIFDPFFTTKKVGRGTGQGLTIVHNLIVKNHGGNIAIDTKEGIGTTFTVRLPIGSHVANMRDK